MIRCTSLTIGALFSSIDLVVLGRFVLVSVKSMAVSVNSCSIESTDSVSVWP